MHFRKGYRSTGAILLLLSLLLGCGRGETFELGEKPSAVGKVTAIDESGRFLIVGPAENGKQPDAAWYDMAEDAVLESGGAPLLPADVKIGSEVNVWGGGLMLTSYPGQTEGLRLEVTAVDDGEGELQGRVTGVENAGESVNRERYLEVDGTRYRLLPITRVWIGGQRADVADIRNGDVVRLWFIGYEVGAEAERMVTQVSVERAASGRSDPFVPGVAIESKAGGEADAKTEALLEVVLRSLRAVVAKDRQAFAATLESDGLLDAYEVLLRPEAQYRFYEIDGIAALGGDPNRMNVGIGYERMEESRSDQGVFTFTLRPDANGDWKIATID